MQRTATVQANLDFSDEADAAAKMRCVYATTSILTALWAASPIVEDKISGFQTYRAWIWRDTDRARSGLVPFVFDREDVFTAYTEWALDVPMYFVNLYGLGREGMFPVVQDLKTTLVFLLAATALILARIAAGFPFPHPVALH